MKRLSSSSIYRQQRDIMIKMQQKGQNVQVQIEYPFVSEIFVERENYIQSSEVQTSEDYQATASHFQG